MRYIDPLIKHSRTIAFTLIGLLAASAAHSERLANTGISVQLWSVKEEVTADFEGTLELLAAMDFDAVEFAGVFGPYQDKPELLNDYLDSLGLEASSAHVGVEQLQPDTIDQTIDFYQKLGADLLIVPLDPRAWDPEQIDALVQDLNWASERLTREGMQVGYHNHHLEFRPYKETSFWEYLVESTDPQVVMQLDLAWVVFANQDPAALIRQYGERIHTSHIKAQVTQVSDIDEERWQAAKGDWQAEFELGFARQQAVTDQGGAIQPVIGQDIVDWPQIIAAFEKTDSLEWMVIEQEVYPDSEARLSTVKASKEGLMELLSQ